MQLCTWALANMAKYSALQNAGHAFFVIRGGEGGGEILEEAGTFSGQALLLSYPYPRGGGVQSRRQAPTHRLVHSTYPISNHTQCIKS